MLPVINLCLTQLDSELIGSEESNENVKTSQGEKNGIVMEKDALVVLNITHPYSHTNYMATICIEGNLLMTVVGADPGAWHPSHSSSYLCWITIITSLRLVARTLF